MTAFTAIEKMVRSSADSDLKKDENIKKMVIDIDRLDEIESGLERAEQRELLAQHIVDYLVQNNYITEDVGFDLLNKSNADYGHKEIEDRDYESENDADEDELTAVDPEDDEDDYNDE